MIPAKAGQLPLAPSCMTVQWLLLSIVVLYPCQLICGLLGVVVFAIVALQVCVMASPTNNLRYDLYVSSRRSHANLLMRYPARPELLYEISGGFVQYPPFFFLILLTSGDACGLCERILDVRLQRCSVNPQLADMDTLMLVTGPCQIGVSNCRR